MNHDLISAEHALRENIQASLAPNTRRQYDAALRRWRNHTGGEMPADPRDLALYLSDIGRIFKMPTVRQHAAAIAFAHRLAGHPNPFDDAGVKQTMKGMANKAKHRPKQASGIDKEAYQKIMDTACLPRPGRLGIMETEDEARLRGLTDVTLIGVMRDAMLRRSEAAELRWSDVEWENDGTSRIYISHSKTDQAGEGEVRFVSFAVTNLLKQLERAATGSSVFDLSDSQICRRIAVSAKTARLVGSFSGHSPRVGMAQDLARFGCNLPDIMEAGRWKSPTMPAYYLRSIEAGRGAVARFYDESS